MPDQLKLVETPLAQSGVDKGAAARDDLIFRQFSDWIADGTLLPGQHLVPERLAEKLGVSRTPVVSALKQLKQAGLVEWVKNSGAYVKRWSKAELAQLFELRGVLESLAARHATLTMSDEQLDYLNEIFVEFQDMDANQSVSRSVVARYLAKDRIFHGTIIDASANPVLQRTIAQIHVTTSTFAAGLIRTISNGVIEHQAIVEAMRARDPARAEQQMRQHLQRSVDWLMEEADLERSNPRKLLP